MLNTLNHFSKFVTTSSGRNVIRANGNRKIYTDLVKYATNITNVEADEPHRVPNVDTSLPPSDLVIKRTLPCTNVYVKPRQAWVVNIDEIDENIVSLINLHPDVYGARPRLDLIKQNIHWQNHYKLVDFRHVPVGMEVNKSSRKPWRQKGLGKARHGTRRSHLFLGGGKLHGPRNPTSYFYMLPFGSRLLGLCSTLSIKLAQDDIHIVKDLEIPTENPQYMLDLAKYRKWGPSILFVDVDDMMPKNITLATDHIKYMTLMPVYGLNVYSMLKHETLVLTVAAALKIEERLLFHLYGSDNIHKIRKFKPEDV